MGHRYTILAIIGSSVTHCIGIFDSKEQARSIGDRHFGVDSFGITWTIRPLLSLEAR